MARAGPKGSLAFHCGLPQAIGQSAGFSEAGRGDRPPGAVPLFHSASKVAHSKRCTTSKAPCTVAASAWSVTARRRSSDPTFSIHTHFPGHGLTLPALPPFLHPCTPLPSHLGSSRQIKPPEVQKTKKHSEHSPPLRRPQGRPPLPPPKLPALNWYRLLCAAHWWKVLPLDAPGKHRPSIHFPRPKQPPSQVTAASSPAARPLNVRQPAKKAAPARARPAGPPLPTSEAQLVSVRFAPNAPTSAHPRPARN